MSQQSDLAELADLQTRLKNVNAAIEAITLGAQSYTLDTGQTRQSVTRANLRELNEMRKSLREEISVLETRTCGGGTRVIPAF